MSDRPKDHTREAGIASMMKYVRYLWSLLQHKWYILLAGHMTGAPLWNLIFHDVSKFTPTEFIRYARWYFGNDQDKKEWAIAWHHHQRLNPHHPEYWLLAWRGAPRFYDDIGEAVARHVVVLPMPEPYVREMVADFLSASKVYTGSWNIAAWLNENGPKMHLHSESVKLIAVVMREMGYVSRPGSDWLWEWRDTMTWVTMRATPRHENVVCAGCGTTPDQSPGRGWKRSGTNPDTWAHLCPMCATREKIPFDLSGPQKAAIRRVLRCSLHQNLFEALNVGAGESVEFSPAEILQLLEVIPHYPVMGQMIRQHLTEAEWLQLYGEHKN